MTITMNETEFDPTPAPMPGWERVKDFAAPTPERVKPRRRSLWKCVTEWFSDLFLMIATVMDARTIE